jgi:hypothetical protein
MKDIQCLNKLNQFPLETMNAIRNNISDVNEPPKNISKIEKRIEQTSKIDLLDMSKRSLEDFKNNHFIPQKTNQPMAGTGIKSGNYNLSDYNINSNFQQVDRLIGSDPTYRKKTETGPLFSPVESMTSYVNGTPCIMPNLDRFRQDIKNNKNMEAPCEKIHVGPGIGLNSNIPAAGGFNNSLNVQVRPNNITSYKANQLPGYVVPGKMVGINKPTANIGIGSGSDGCQYGMPKHGPKKYYTREPAPYGQSTINATRNRESYQTLVDKITYDVLNN